MSNLKEKFTKEIVFALQKDLQLKSIMEVPKLEKVVVNIGVGDGAADKKLIEAAVEELMAITNQKPIETKAKKSIAAFKLREGQTIGVKVTLRNNNMWAFVEKLFNIAVPRVRDFRGFSPQAFDGRGNYTLGLKEQTVFNEIVYDKVKKIRGMDITFVTSTDKNEHAYALLKSLGLPFSKGTIKETN